MKKALLIFSITLAVIIIGLFASAEIFEEKIGNAVRTSINQSLKTSFEFEAFDLSMVRSFPFAEVRFQDVHILDIHQDTLLLAERANIKLDMLSLFRSKIAVKSTEVESGRIRLRVDKKGLGNYEIFADDNDAKNSSTSFSIKEAQIRDMAIRYTDVQHHSEVDLYADDLLMTLDFQDEVLISALGTIDSKKISVDHLDYLVDQNLSINSRIRYHQKDRILSIDDGEIGVEGIVVYADGKITYNGDHELYDLVLSNTDGKLESIFKLLPKNTVEEFKKISSFGDFDLNVFYKGKQSKYSNPSLQADLTYARGRIVIPQFGIPLKNVSFTAKYLDKSKKGLMDAGFQINAFKASLDGERISGDIAYDNFKNPYLKLQADGKMPIQTVLDILDVEADDMNGNLDFNKLVINGLLKDLSSPINQPRTVSEIDVVLDNISFKLEDQDVVFRDGQLVGQGDFFELKDLEVRTPKSVFALDGYIKKLVPFIFAEYQRPHLEFDLDVHSATCDIAEVLSLTNSPLEEESTKTTSKTSTSSYYGSMNGDISLTIDRFEHEKISGSDFKGNLSFINGNALVKGSANGMKGSFDLEAMIQGKSDRPSIEAKVICNNVDVRTFFDQTNNFGQNTLEGKHLKGRLYSQLLINGNWLDNGSFNQNGLKVFGNAQIRDGELIDFKMMENFSSFVKIEDLQHIKFGRMDNYFEIKNKVIHIPAMFIQSNAVNLTLSGEHAFNNAIDYKVKVNAGQVLTNKLKKHDRMLRPIPARKRGFFNLYYAIKGTINDPSYKTAKRQVKSDFVQSEYQKSKIKVALDRAFPQKKSFQIITDPEEQQDNKLQFETEGDELLDPIVAGSKKN